MNIQPIILSGGAGTRLWPLSRPHLPKQYLKITGELTLFQETIDRLQGIHNTNNPVTVCNEQHRQLVLEQFSQIDEIASLIVLESTPRNTAPALTLATLALMGTTDNNSYDPIMLVVPADHRIISFSNFQDTVQEGARLARNGYLVTFGIPPTYPVTEYGYILKGNPIIADHPSYSDCPLFINGFVEKPNSATATTFVASGKYLWNSGIFMMRGSLWLKVIENQAPKILEVCKQAITKGRRIGHIIYPNSIALNSCPNISIDYAVMEKVAIPDMEHRDTKCAVLPMDAGWSDLGSWSAIWKQSKHDENGNVITGDVRTESVENSLILSSHRSITAIGLRQMVIVETTDAILISGLSQTHDVKHIITTAKIPDSIKTGNIANCSSKSNVIETLTQHTNLHVELVTLGPRVSMPIQTNEIRQQYCLVVRGTITIVNSTSTTLIGKNELVDIQDCGAISLENPNRQAAQVITVSLTN